MKNFRIVWAVGFLALLTACGNTKSTTTEPKATIGEQAPNRGRSNTQANAETRTVTNSTTRTTTTTSPTRVTRATNDGSTRAATTSDRTAATNNADSAQKAKMQKMYTDLDMNDEQISRFEKAWKASTGSYSNSNSNSDTAMNSFERTEAQDKIMRDILSASQFEKYQEWAIENAE